ncbi:MAG TPA: universal stress protein [Pyrinomonadaceae bacterium]|jgi:nucleotide-binding universal stress UspA family protein
MKILIATDGSEFSRQAIEKACEMLADKGNNSVEIVSVYEEVANAAAEPFAVSAEYIQEMEKLGREQAAAFVSEAEEIIRERFKDSTVQITTKIVKGTPGRAIVEEAQDWGADLIVVGSHGYGFWGRAFLGSTSDKVVHHAPCSVLVVRKKPDFNDA